MAQTALIVAAVAATALTANGQYQAGKSADQYGRYKANQEKTAAGQEQAEGQRAAANEQRQAQLVISRARAVGAAGGGDTTDKGVSDILGGIAGEGEYRSLAQLYNGNERAAGLFNQANADIFEGKQKKKAGTMAAVTTILSSAVQMGAGSMGGSSANLASSPTASQGYLFSNGSMAGSDLGTSMPWRV